jgi:hypothetical protein
VREWNYGTNLHTPGGMTDRELLAAADFACQREVWDRCINTSERTKTVFDMAQRFPMPFRDAVVRARQGSGLDPAYVYGLIRQESRFIMDARSQRRRLGPHAGDARHRTLDGQKIGLTGFTPDQITDRDTNIAIGTAYLKLALDDFAAPCPWPLPPTTPAPAARATWRNGPVLDAAIWAENVPFNETRDYVKKVLANTTNYARPEGPHHGAAAVAQGAAGTVASDRGAAKKMTRILILGGTGFVGRHVCEKLARLQSHVTVATRRTATARDLITLPLLQPVECDVHDEAALTRLVAGHDAVVNLVAILHGTRPRSSAPMWSCRKSWRAPAPPPACAAWCM